MAKYCSDTTIAKQNYETDCSLKQSSLKNYSAQGWLKWNIPSANLPAATLAIELQGLKHIWSYFKNNRGQMVGKSKLCRYFYTGRYKDREIL